jgi:hypothetical protein
MSRWPRTLGAIALILLTLGGGHLLIAGQPSTAAQLGPYLHEGNIGDTVDVSTMAVTVIGVRGTTALNGPNGTMNTSGVFVFVKLRINAYSEPVFISDESAHVRDGNGVTYAPTTLIRQPMEGTYQPGTPTESELVFEVQRHSALSLTLRLGTAVTSDEQLRTIAEVHLGITPLQVALWLANDRPINPMEQEISQ